MRKRIPHSIIDGIDCKFCKSCESGTGRWLPLGDFNKKAASYDGLETKCKACAQLKSAQFRQENPNFDKEYQLKNSDRLKEYKREYYKRKKAGKVDPTAQ